MNIVVLGPGRSGTSAFVTALHDAGIAFSAGELTSYFYDFFRICNRGTAGINPEIAALTKPDTAWGNTILSLSRELLKPPLDSDYSATIYKLIGLPDDSLFNVNFESLDKASHEHLLDKYCNFISAICDDCTAAFFYRHPFNQIISSIARWRFSPARAISILDFQLQGYSRYSTNIDCRLLESEKLREDPSSFLFNLLSPSAPIDSNKVAKFTSLILGNSYAETNIDKQLSMRLSDDQIQYELSALESLQCTCAKLGKSIFAAGDPLEFRSRLLTRLNKLGIDIVYTPDSEQKYTSESWRNSEIDDFKQYIHELESGLRFLEAENHNLTQKIQKDDQMYVKMQAWITELQRRLQIE